MEPDIEPLLDMEPFVFASAASASPAKPAVNRTRAAIFPRFFMAFSFLRPRAPCPAPFICFSQATRPRLQQPAKISACHCSRGDDANVENGTPAPLRLGALPITLCR